MEINFQAAENATKSAVARNIALKAIFQAFHQVLVACLDNSNFAALVTSISPIDRRDSFDIESSLGYLARFRYTPGTGEAALRGRVLVVVWRLGEEEDKEAARILATEFTFDRSGVTNIAVSDEGTARLDDAASAMYIVQTTFLETLAKS